MRTCFFRKTGTKRAVKIIKKDKMNVKEKAKFFQELEILR